jgi:hypothetical protein
LFQIIKKKTIAKEIFDLASLAKREREREKGRGGVLEERLIYVHLMYLCPRLLFGHALLLKVEGIMHFCVY